MAQCEQTQLYITVNRIDGDGWTVDVSENGLPAILQDVRIADPLTPSQRETCRWYIEQYIQKSPFSVDKASEAESLFHSYAETLLAALGLREALLLRHGPFRRDPGSNLLYINICQNAAQCSGETIHQLFWETLEHPRLWSSDVQVVVHRSISADAKSSGVEPDAIVPWVGLDGKATVNVLLVVARDLRHDESKLQDASPALAITIILKIKNELKERDSPVQVNLEVVRPGTWKALKEHLQHTKDSRGPGYFHLVHFDVHGKVGLRQKSTGNKLAVLYLSTQYGEATVAVPTSSLCEIVKEHRIPFVVLNACDSATSLNVDETNTAQQFLKSGARNAVGMSFRISSSSAEVFLAGFYRALLLDHLSFAVSAAVGRESLRLNPNRPSRYGLQTALKDSFVAATYGPAHVGFVGNTDSRRLFSFFNHSEASPMAQHSLNTVQFLGRAFDLLRVERLLSQSPILYLSGPVGVGKSAFLEHATSVWKETHWADAVVSIDLALEGQISGSEFSAMIHRQLLSQVPLAYQYLGLWTIPSLHLDSHSVDDMIANVASRINSVIIVEGLEFFPIDPLPRSLRDSKTIGALALVKTLLSLARDTSRTPKCRVIFTQRRASPQGVEGLIDYQFGPYCYDLRGLDLPDAIELSSGVLKACGTHIQKWNHEDAEWLESIVLLLRSNPLAIRAILPLHKRLAIPWRLFYANLHGGLFKTVQDLREQCPEILSSIDDFYSLRVLPQSVYFLCCLLSMFWRESVHIIRLLPYFNATATTAVKRDLYVGGIERVTFALKSFALGVLDRGYVRPGVNDDILELSPIFTIVGRAFLAEHITLATRVRHKSMFGASLEVLVSDFTKRTHSALSADNYLTVMTNCVKEVPVEHWPLTYILSIREVLLGDLPRSLWALLLGTLCELLEALLYKLPLLAEKKQHVGFFCFSMLCFTSGTSNFDKKLCEKALKLSQSGMDLLSHLNIHGSDETFLTCRGLLLFASTSSLALLRRDEEFQTSAKAFKKAMEVSMTESSNVGLFLEGLRTAPPNGLAAEEEAERRGLKILDRYVGSPEEGLAHTRRWLTFMALFLAELGASNPWSGLGSSLGSGWPERFETVLNTMFANHQTFDQSFATSIHDPYRMLMLDFLDSKDLSGEPLDNIVAEEKVHDLLEQMYDKQEWFGLCDEHLRMAQKSFQQQYFEDGLRHLVAIQRILEKASVPESLLPAIQACKSRAVTASLDHRYKMAVLPTRYFDISEQYESSELSSTGTSSKGPPATDVPKAGKRGERGRSLKEWWDWLHKFLGQDATWAHQILMHQNAYPNEAALMKKVYEVACCNDHAQVLHQLGLLENICKGTVFVTFPQVYPLQAIRDAMEVGLYQQEMIKDILDLGPEDPGGAKTQLDKLQHSIPKFCTWIDQTVIDDLRLATAKHQLMYFRMRLLTPEPDSDLHALYEGFRHHLDIGTFNRLDKGVVSGVGLSWVDVLTSKTIANRAWDMGRRYIEGLHQSLSANLQVDPEIQAAFWEARREIQRGSLQDSLDEAEACLDFLQCSSLAGKMEELLSDQEKDAILGRPMLVTISSRKLGFMKRSYQKRCLPCAHWVRQGCVEDLLTKHNRASRIFSRVMSILLSRRKGIYRSAGLGCRRLGSHKVIHSGGRSTRRGVLRSPRHQNVCNHDRSQFKVPFGCQHHCVGGYCLID